jgi:hypothetical protein
MLARLEREGSSAASRVEDQAHLPHRGGQRTSSNGPIPSQLEQQATIFDDVLDEDEKRTAARADEEALRPQPPSGPAKRD